MLVVDPPARLPHAIALDEMRGLLAEHYPGTLAQFGEPGLTAVTEVAATNARLAAEFTPGPYRGELLFCGGPESDPTPWKALADGGVSATRCRSPTSRWPARR
ncbi:hypothetical protein [Amycolatopsis sp. MtRt-6]|uniref:hypothetical protein n=1 Tax=Amycolatopsis sp. MtRt-6 TaxID=2792782 RepID=UPI001F5D82C8|nr:hypothetical protein [Amycolatopsis sp. MtRt-6]